MRGRAGPVCSRRNRNLRTKDKSSKSSIRIRCIFRLSQDNEAPRQAGRHHAFILSQLDLAPASTSATILPIINRQERRAPENTEGLSRPAEDSRTARNLLSAIRDNAEENNDLD